MNFFQGIQQGIQRIGAGIMAAATAFRNTVFSSSPENADDFQAWPGRSKRYLTNWAFYENLQYDKANSLASEYKNVRGLYKHIRSIYNPVLRLGDFWTQAIWRGSIDADAGNTGAIPIVMGKKAVEETLRAVIALIVKASNWNVNKDILVLHGSILGDAAIYIRNDSESEKTRLEVLHPGRVVEADLDAMGFVKRYVIEYDRVDNEGRQAKYTEICEHGEAENEIIFRTYRDDIAYVWDGNVNAEGEPAWEWSVLYGFVPLVLIQHKNVGRDWGLCEFHAQEGKISEINDEASLLNDQIRKTVNAKFLANWKKPETIMKIQSATSTSDRPAPEREDTNMVYIDKDNAKIQPFVAPLDIDKVLGNLAKMLEELEDDLPELKAETWSGGSGPSDSTILAARGRVEGKVDKRRAGYDTGFVRAIQMAITIGAVNDYPGYAAYNLESYQQGTIDFSISPRAAFPLQPSEITANKTAFWDGWSKVSTSQTVSFRTYARDMGWTDEQIDLAEKDLAKMTGEIIPASGQ